MEKGQGKGTDTLQTDNVITRKEYIEREAAIKRFTFVTLDCLGMEPTIRAADVVVALKAIPAADVVPVRHGKWKIALLDHESFGVRSKVLYCSECHKCIAYPTNYCPNCGALMDKDGDGDV